MRSTVEIETPVGLARAEVRLPDGPPTGTLVLGHGAGGGLSAVDLQAVARRVIAAGWIVVLVEQPWKVAGRKVAGPPKQLDTAWTAVVQELARQGVFAGPLVLGGRSAGARVACRTATALGAAAVCCVAFPLHPPGRPERSRAEELAGVEVPALVVQGRRDAFGSPEEVLAAMEGTQADVRVVAVDGDHGLKVEPATVGVAVVEWLGALPRREDGRRG
jgi:predicted alpha/beta-hydrolase family hydrolase